MARRADDYRLHIDIDSRTGEIMRTLVLSQECPRDTARWSAERAAAVQGVTSWLAWCASHDPSTYAWLASLTEAQREGLRAAMLSGA